MKICKNCSSEFQITEDDKNFYKKIEVSEPKFCPECRLQRRLAFRNERYLFKRKCDLCTKEIFSFYDPLSPYTVYCHDCWWSDKWDPLKYGRDYDFKKTFFQQFDQLMKDVPKVGMLLFKNENCDFNSLMAFSKNSYMSPGSYYMEDSYYVRKSQYSKDCLNGIFLDHCELVSESVNCQNCYNCYFLINCRNCSDSKYLADSNSCKNCFMCSGISHQEFCYKNKKYSEQDYNAILKDQLSRRTEELEKEFLEFNKTIPKKYQNQLNCEDCEGDYLQNCKNAKHCYDCFDVEDSKYLYECVNVKDSMDITMHDKEVELCYELCTGGEKSYNHALSVGSLACPNTKYLYSCYYLSDSFGCDGFHNKQKFCIFNKKYSEKEFEIRKKMIIKHMKETGEYGELFPVSISPFAYNHTLAQDFYPLDKETVIRKGYKWKNDVETGYAGLDNLPNCSICNKVYKVIPQEYELCKRLGHSVSKLCINCRFKKLMSLKNPRKLWDRSCDRCHKGVKSTYQENSSEKILCDKCYLK